MLERKIGFPALRHLFAVGSLTCLFLLHKMILLSHFTITTVKQAHLLPSVSLFLKCTSWSGCTLCLVWLILLGLTTHLQQEAEISQMVNFMARIALSEVSSPISMLVVEFQLHWAFRQESVALVF